MAEFLKMVVKVISQALPLIEIPPPPLPPFVKYHFYFQYVFIIFAFWLLLKRAENLDWDIVYEKATRPLRMVYSKGRENFSEGMKKFQAGKEALKLLIRIPERQKNRRAVKQVRGERQATGSRWRATGPRQQAPGIRRQAARKRSRQLSYRQLREWEKDLDKRLRRTKYWANYLVSLSQSKH